MIRRAWEGPRPEWVKWTGRAAQAVSPCVRVLTTDLDPSLPGATPARRSNIYRLEVLYHSGGLWLDCDMVPLVDLYRLHDEPWMGYAGGKLRAGVAFFPEPGHPALPELIERVRADPGPPLADHIAAAGLDVRPEPRVLPHDAKGRWLIGGDTPLAVHLWLSTGRLSPHTPT